jgi:hypothetical protein
MWLNNTLEGTKWAAKNLAKQQPKAAMTARSTKAAWTVGNATDGNPKIKLVNLGATLHMT